MAGPSYPIGVDLSHLIPAGSRLTSDTFPNLAYAVGLIGQQAHQDWIAYAMGRPLPGGQVIQNRTGEYARSIMLRSTGEFAVEVYSELPYAHVIEEGRAAHDMKTMLNSSLKVRLTKDGRRYLIIPIRHNAPGSVLGNDMPAAVHDWWQQNRTPSHINGTYRRTSGTGVHDTKTRQLVTVPGWNYRWGDRLGQSHLAAMGIEGQRAKHLAGMVNFRNPGGMAGGGAKQGTHSQYLTFRVMVEGSKGWMARAQPPKPAAASTAAVIRPLAEAAFAAAMEADIRALLE